MDLLKGPVAMNKSLDRAKVLISGNLYIACHLHLDLMDSLSNKFAPVPINPLRPGLAVFGSFALPEATYERIFERWQSMPHPIYIPPIPSNSTWVLLKHANEHGVIQ